MGKLFGRGLLVLAVYTVIFLFTDNSVDATRKANFKDIAPAIFMRGADIDSIIAKARLMNIDVSTGLYKALDHNPDVSDIVAKEYDATLDALFKGTTPLNAGGDLVQLSFNVGKDYDVEIIFVTHNKRYLRNFTQFAGPVDIKISHDGKEHDIDDPDTVQHLFGAIFDENRHLLPQMVRYACNA